MQWLIAAALLIVGIYLSAFFSGIETGFYRVSRIRLELDARAGDRKAHRVLGLVSKPAMFVATTLVGNNVANYLTMLATVYFAQYAMHASAHPELVATLLVTPLVFVYGELMPKNLYFQAPGLLLRRRARLIYASTVLLWPASMPLAGLTRLLSRLAGQPPQRASTLLGRRRLEQLFHEGHEEGLLTQSQRQLVQGLFGIAERSVTHWITPAGRMVAMRSNTAVRDVLRLTRRQRLTYVALRAEGPTGDWVGYVRASELAVADGLLSDHTRPLIELSSTQSSLQSLIQLYQCGEDLGLVLDAQGRALGFVSKRRLCEGLYRASP